MAKATVIEIPYAPVKPIKQVTLILTDAEAQTLADILGMIGGNPVTTRRKHADSIDNALSSVGFDSQPPSDVCDELRRIYFTEAQE
jgi:hypothetical protein